MTKEVGNGTIRYECEDPKVSVVANLTPETEAWFIHVYTGDIQALSCYYTGEYGRLADLCEVLYKWIGGVWESDNVGDLCKAD